MTIAQKRVLIAKDVIAQIRSRRIKATPGLYFASDKLRRIMQSAKPPKGTTQLNTVLKEVKRCEGCAQGALMLCIIDRFNKVKVNEVNRNGYLDPGHDTERKAMLKIFPKGQLDLMEAAFDGFSHKNTSGGAAVNFYLKNPVPGKRLVAIMENVIKNNGEFKP